MTIIIHLLIIMFILLIGLQIFLAYSNDNIMEGLKNNNSKTYIEYDSNDALILSKQNAANIQFLKQQIEGLNNTHGEVDDLSGNVAALQTQVDGLVQSQQDYTNNVTSSNSELSTSYDDSSGSDNANIDNTNEDNTTTDNTSTDPNNITS